MWKIRQNSTVKTYELFFPRSSGEKFQTWIQIFSSYDTTYCTVGFIGHERENEDECYFMGLDLDPLGFESILFDKEKLTF